MKSELSGLHENVQNFNPRCNRSREIQKKTKCVSIVRHPVKAGPLSKSDKLIDLGRVQKEEMDFSEEKNKGKIVNHNISILSPETIF